MTLIVVAKEKQAEHSALAQFQLPIFLWSSQEKVQDTRDIDSKVCAVSNCLGVGALLNFSLQKGLVALIPRRVFFFLCQPTLRSCFAVAEFGSGPSSWGWLENG